MESGGDTYAARVSPVAIAVPAPDGGRPNAGREEGGGSNAGPDGSGRRSSAGAGEWRTDALAGSETSRPIRNPGAVEHRQHPDPDALKVARPIRGTSTAPGVFPDTLVIT
jgi:hypothetical protein